MRTLVMFFWNHRFLTLFLVLETVSILLLVQSYSYQRSLTMNAVNDVTGTIFKFSSDVTDYFSLKKQNENLIEENTRLYNRLSIALSQEITDSTITKHFLEYIPARVISNTVNKRNNYILVDKGSHDSIEKEMGVVSINGLVGVVIGVSPHFSLIMSMLNHNALISARIKKNSQLVNVVWNTNDFLFGTVTDIPSYLQLQKGDTIVTSGNSLIFPRNVMIGFIERFKADSLKSLNSATLRFSTDFNSLHYVYIIKNWAKKEQQTLFEKQIP